MATGKNNQRNDGKGSVNHNTRVFKAKNVDAERSKDNLQFCQTNIKTVYHQIFDKALERYNAKQKRNDRKIDNYYEKIRRGKQEKLFHEVIFQIGNKDDMNARSVEGQKAKEILSEFMQTFQDRNPNLHVFSAHLHMDEETPHLHIDFVPFIQNSKRGLDTRVSLKGALAEQGFKGGIRGTTEWNQWIDSEKWVLSKVMERHGIQWKQLGTHNKHLSVLDFEKQERQKEVAELALTSDLLREETETLADDKDKLLVGNQELKRQQDKLQREINKMVDSKVGIERSIHAYDEDEKWQLPAPGLFMIVNSFREKKALPLVQKLKQVIKNLIIKCVNLTQEVNRLTDKVMRQDGQINRLTDRAMEQRDIIKRLQGKSADLERIECYMGKEKVQTIIGRVKEIETLEKANKRSQRSRGLSR
ncbi:plasmid recombination protein [Robinsoniella peoriensis]|uniref:plasmid recombination protein n=1 Tax=Robinsoniella peoriensis TaxID=180332 RepID=UPI00375317B3